MVCSGMNDFGGGMPCNRVMKPVLHHCIKSLCCRGRTVIVNATLGIDVGYLLPDATLAGADRADALQELAEIVTPENSIALLQPVIIKHKALADKLVENPRRPLAKFSSPLTVNTISDADYGIKGIKSLLSLDLTIALLLNY